VEAEIKPDPTPEERTAILAALESVSADGPPAYRSVWREQGVRENDDDVDFGE